MRLPERFVGYHWVNPPHLMPLVEIIKCKGPMGVGHAVATVDGEKACEAEIKFIIGE